MAVGVDIFDQKILTFDPSKFPHAAAETIDIGVRRDGEPGDARAGNRGVSIERIASVTKSAKALGRDIELARISQEVTERFYEYRKLISELP